MPSGPLLIVTNSIKILPDGNTVITINSQTNGNDQMQYIDVSNPSDISISANIFIPTSSGVEDMAVGSVNAYVSDAYGDLWTLDIASQTVTGSVLLIDILNSMFFSPDQSLIYSTNYNDNVFYVFNVAENTITASIPFSDSLYYVMLDPLDTNYAIGNNASEHMFKIDLTTFAIASLAVGNADQFDISTITGNIYTGDASTDNIWIIDESTFTVTGSIPTQAGIYSVGFVDGGTLLFALDKNFAIEVVDTTVGSVIYTISDFGALGSNVAYFPMLSFNYLVHNTTTAFSVLEYDDNPYVSAIALENVNIENAAPLNGVGAGLSLNSGSVGLTSYQTYQELTSSNLTAQTTTSLTPVTATGGTLSMTATVTGDIIIDAIIRGSNNTLSDGITVGIYAGTTPIDSETYTQEGVAGNEHTFVFHSSQTISLSTATEYSVMYNAVTGGTASIKLVDLTVKEVS